MNMGMIEVIKFILIIVMVIALWELNRFRLERKKEEYIASGEKEIITEK